MDAEQQRRKREREFLDNYIFVGLENLNDGFDSSDIKYFSEEDFAIVIQRIRKLGLGIYGIEPWKDGDYYGVQVHEQVTEDPTDPNWYEEAFKDFKSTGEKLLYAATYHIPDRHLVG
ncbi:MAG: hypothetical protein DI539_16550 [Flavobacterium psychrophilum]|nr:MAG: hypothetical protein DI539_16550 [Flavobacterium psychrophilum]